MKSQVTFLHSYRLLGFRCSGESKEEGVKSAFFSFS